MRYLAKIEMLLAAALLTVTSSGPAQTVVNPSGQKIMLAGQPVPAVEARKLNEKQKALADETDTLLSMATVLKEQVDMTSRNILSVKVVRQAEEIEFYARRIKSDAKK